MKKKLFVMLFILTLSTFGATKSFAVDQTFIVSATIPTATSVGINAFSVNPDTNAFTPVAGTSLSFDPMTLNSVNQIYLPNHFFAIDVVGTGGAGSPSATITYSEGTNPNTPAHGLGWKSTATFMKVTYVGPLPTDTSEAPLTGHGPKKLLKDVTGESITNTETAGGWLRLYVGIVTKDPAATIPDPAAGEVFSNADKAGAYDGTLFISATVS